MCLKEDEQCWDINFTDKSTIEMDSHTKLRRIGDFQTDKNGPKHGLFHGLKMTPKPKHPSKLHVLVGMSSQGATMICLLDGIMRKEFYVEEILQDTIKEFLDKTYPEGHRFMQDNDPIVSC